ncbi:MAG: LuxR C-terminal-related transcriptional regulator [Cyanobacteria bacterium J06555_13]
MKKSLQDVLVSISNSNSEQALKEHLIPKIRNYFNTTRQGIFFFDSPGEALQKQALLRKSPFKEAIASSFSIENNPVLHYLLERHAPVHEALVTSPRVWTAICPRADHWHVMAGPIVSRGQLVGLVGCTRGRSMDAFDEQSIVDLSAMCLHLSAWVSTVRSQNPKLGSKHLAPRELQIAALVAQGKTNSEIGDELWIAESSVKQALKRMFRKLEVSSRTEMVTKLLQQDTISGVV